VSRGKQGRFVGLEEAMASIPDGARVLVGAGCGVPLALVDGLDAMRAAWNDLHVVVGYLLEPLAVFGDGGPFRFTSLHPTPAVASIEPTRLEVVPMRYGDHPWMLGAGGPLQPDVVLVQVSAPSRDGRYSLGVSVGGLVDALRSAPLVIAQVNERCPYTFGESELDADDVDLFVAASTPLVEAPEGEPSPRVRGVAAHAAGEIDDGAAVQIGVGRLPTAVLDALHGHRDLVLRSGLFTDGCRRLVEGGALTGVCTTAEIMGDAALFAWVDHNAVVRTVGARTSHGLATLARLPNFVAINSALEVDEVGAVNSERGDDGRVVSGPGGLPDFVAAALAAESGRSVIALPSVKSDGTSRIVTQVSHVTLPPFLADRVCTEHGVARLRGLSLDARRRALRAISS
jgi:acetyl-CoA hydrolase